MAIWDKLRGELIDIIEWLDDSRDTMVWRFPRYENEIKYGAKLIVRESQAAAFINEGALADLFLQPGTFTLETKNLPILATLRGWKYGFESPFKAEVYFVNTRTFTDRKWGTKNPIMLRDPEFGPTRLRAFGSFAIKVQDPAVFLRNVVGTGQRFTVDEIGEQLRDMMVGRFADVLGESKMPVLDMAANQDELGNFLTTRLRDDFATFGLQLVKLVVENISLPPEVEQALDTRTKMGVIGDLSRYTQFQAAEAMRDAAKNPGGIAGAGVGFGAGMAIGNQMGTAMGTSMAGAGTPPPVPGAAAAAPQQTTYFVAVDGQQKGPFTLDQLRSEISAGRVQRNTLAWRNGMPNWTALEQVPDLAALFTNVPPPLPPNS